MLSRLGHVLLIVAFIGATGAHWAVLQTVAWTAMLVDNAGVSTLSVAIEKTLDGKHPCALCKQIASGRSSEKKSDFQTQGKKLDFLNQLPAIAVVSPVNFFTIRRHHLLASLAMPAPPVPPPRSLPV